MLLPAMMLVTDCGCWHCAWLAACLARVHTATGLLHFPGRRTLPTSHPPRPPHTCTHAAQGLGVQPVAFLRLPSFALYWLLKRMAGSPRARERLWSQQYTDNGTTVADHTIAILLGLVGGACVLSCVLRARCNINDGTMVADHTIAILLGLVGAETVCSLARWRASER